MSVFLQVLYTVLALGFLIFIHELGHFIFSKIFHVQVNEFSLGMGPKLISIKKGRVSWIFSKVHPEKEHDGYTAYSIRLLPIGGFVSLEGENDGSSSPNALETKPAWQRLIIMLAGAFMNLLVAFLVILVLNIRTPLASLTIAEFTDDSVSQTCGLQTGDTIVKIGDTAITTYTDIARAFQSEIGKDSVAVTVERNGEDIVLDNVKFPLINSQGDYATEEEIKNGDLVMFTVDFRVWAQEKTFFGVLSATFKDTASEIGTMTDTLKLLVTGRISAQYVSGPVGVSSVIKEAADYGIDTLLYVVGFISANLAVVNLLPLPALDGGQSVFILIEMITRKKVPEKIRATVNTIGMILILGLAAVIAVKDIIFL